MKRKSIVDFGLYAAAGMTNLDDIQGVAERGAIAFKTYTVAPPEEKMKELEGSFVTEAGDLLEVMERVSRTGLTHCFHSEENSIIRHLSQKLVAEGRRDSLTHYDSRPYFAEAIAIFEVVSLAKAVGTKVHIVHVSTKEGTEIVMGAKREGASVTCETCPHYLFFDKDSLEKFGPVAKFNPPTRLPDDIEALWSTMKNGTIDIVVSDHAPHTQAEKNAGRTNMWVAPSGTPGVESTLPFLLTYGPAHDLSITDIARMTSTSVARIFGLAGRKGDIRTGLDADFTIVDPKVEWILKAENLQSKSKSNTLFDSMTFKGEVQSTFVRGEMVYERGVGFGRPGTGEFLPGSAYKSAGGH